MNSSLYHLTTAQLKLFVRDPGVVFWAFVFPILMAWALGIAFSNQGEVVRTVAVLDDGSSAFVRLKERVKTLDTTQFKFLYTTHEEATLTIQRGKAFVMVEAVEADYRFHFDTNNSDAQLTYLLLKQALEGNVDTTNNQVVELTAKGSRYIDFLIPGLLAVSIMNASIWGIGLVLIEQRIKKLMRLMVATSMRRSLFLCSHFLNRLFIGALEWLVLYCFAYWYFEVPFTGSLGALALVFICGNAAFAGFAILVSSRAQNAQTGNGLVNASTLPMYVVSGVFFSYHTFPDWAIAIIQYLPLTLLADSIRSIFLEGAGFAEVWSASAILLTIGAAMFLLGLKIYKWH